MAFYRAGVISLLLGIVVMAVTVIWGAWYGASVTSPGDPRGPVWWVVLGLDVGASVLFLFLILMFCGVIVEEKKENKLLKTIKIALLCGLAVPAALVIIFVVGELGPALLFGHYLAPGCEEVYKNPVVAMPWLNRTLFSLSSFGWLLLLVGGFLFGAIFSFSAGVFADKEGGKDESVDKTDDNPVTAEINTIGHRAYLLGAGHEGGGIVTRKKL